MTTVFEWLNGRGGAAAAFPEHYARARRVGAEVHVDLILEIADDATNDWMEQEATNGNEKARKALENGEAINRSRLRIESRKWIASKLLPKIYGERQQLDVTHRYEDLDDDALNSEIEAALAARQAAGGQTTH